MKTTLQQLIFERQCARLRVQDLLLLVGVEPRLSSLPAVEGAEGAPSLDPVDGAEVDERTLDAAEPPDAEPAAGGFGWSWT